MNNIFICVPTMNDKEFLSTVERAYDYAKNPDNLSISTTIFWKNEDIKKNHLPFFLNIKRGLDKNFKNVKYDIQPWAVYPGVGNGRLSPIKHFNNEKYFLSIDSHTDFTKDWDSNIIELYENSRKYFGKLRILTTYLTPYCNSIDDYSDDWTNKTNNDKAFNNSKDTLYYKKDITNRWAFFDFYKQFGNLEARENIFPLPNDRYIDYESFDILKKNLIENLYIPAKKISAHFYFTESNPWLTKYNLNLDKNIKFWGEEFYQSSLSYARGYNLVWYKTQIMFHKYNDLGDKSNFRSYKNSSLKEYESIEEKNNIYNEYVSKLINFKLNKNINIGLNDNQIILNLFKNENNFGYLPRSINGFLKYSGIDLINKKTSGWYEVPEINVVYK